MWLALPMNRQPFYVLRPVLSSFVARNIQKTLGTAQSGKRHLLRRTSILVQAQSGRERPFPPCVYLAPRSQAQLRRFLKTNYARTYVNFSKPTHLASLQLRSRLPSGLVGLCSAYYCKKKIHFRQLSGLRL